MVSQNDVINCFYNIHPDGDIGRVVSAINLILSSNETTPWGEPVTFELLCTQYKKYIEAWKHEWSGRDNKYMKDANRKKIPIDFLNAEMYKQLFIIEKQSRDHFFFGKMSMEEFDEAHKQFLKEL